MFRKTTVKKKLVHCQNVGTDDKFSFIINYLMVPKSFQILIRHFTGFLVIYLANIIINLNST